MGDRMVKNEQKHNWNVAEIITWIGIGIMLLWAIGKSFGWISSPVWVDMIPVYGAAAALSGISVSIGKTLQKLDRVISDVERLERTVIEHGERIYMVETKLNGR